MGGGSNVVREGRGEREEGGRGRTGDGVNRWEGENKGRMNKWEGGEEREREEQVGGGREGENRGGEEWEG